MYRFAIAALTASIVSLKEIADSSQSAADAAKADLNEANFELSKLQLLEANGSNTPAPTPDQPVVDSPPVDADASGSTGIDNPAPGVAEDANTVVTP